MENILRNPGLQHIIEKSLKCLGNKDIASFQLLNQDCKKIVDCPRFYLMKLSQQENVPNDLIQEWKKLITKLDDKDIEKDLTSELSKMNGQRELKYPLGLAYYLSDEKKKLELAMFIIENSDEKNYVKAKEGLIGILSPMHLAAVMVM